MMLAPPLKFSLLLWLFLLFGCSALSGTAVTAETVNYVDLSRYAGKWYEIAAFPAWFEKGCHCSTAEYELKDGLVAVKNSCRRDSPSGELKVATAKALTVANSNNSRLKVQFFWPFKGDYWIIYLDNDYRYVLVGHPQKKYLWILSRTPQIDKTVYDDLVKIAADKGYDTRKLKLTSQACP